MWLSLQLVHVRLHKVKRSVVLTSAVVRNAVVSDRVSIHVAAQTGNVGGECGQRGSDEDIGGSTDDLLDHTYRDEDENENEKKRIDMEMIRDKKRRNR